MSDTRDDEAGAASGAPLRPAYPLEPTRARPEKIACPVCGEQMQVEAYRGIKIDACAKHGIWLDSGELSDIIDRVETRDRTRAHALGEDYAREARRGGKVSGALFGFWSLLWD